jgi:hypothetical protein
MKKLIIVALALATASTLSAQGLVKFSTTGGRVSFATVAEGETAYKVGDFLGSDFIGVVKLDGKEIGRANFSLSGGGAPTGRLAGDVLAIDGLAAGGAFTFTMEAFNAAYEAADKSLLIPGGPDGLYFGKSAAFDYKTGVAGSVDPNDAALAMNVPNFGVDAYSVIPEPTTIALGVLGLSSLLLFRRRD